MYFSFVLAVAVASPVSSSVTLTSDKNCFENAGTAELTAKYTGKLTERKVTWYYRNDNCFCSLDAYSCSVTNHSAICSNGDVDVGFPVKRVKFYCNNVTREYKITITDLHLRVTASSVAQWGVSFTLEDGNSDPIPDGNECSCVYRTLNQCGEFFYINLILGAT